MPLTSTSHAEVDPLAAGLRGYYNIHRLSGAENHWATHFTGKEITGSHLFRHNRRPLSLPGKNSMALNFTLSEHAGEDYCSPLSLSFCELNRKSLRMLQFIETLRI